MLYRIESRETIPRAPFEGEEDEKDTMIHELESMRSHVPRIAPEQYHCADLPVLQIGNDLANRFRADGKETAWLSSRDDAQLIESGT